MFWFFKDIGVWHIAWDLQVQFSDFRIWRDFQKFVRILKYFLGTFLYLVTGYFRWDEGIVPVHICSKSQEFPPEKN